MKHKENCCKKTKSKKKIRLNTLIHTSFTFSLLSKVTLPVRYKTKAGRV